jgi:hypothetical protein
VKWSVSPHKSNEAWSIQINLIAGKIDRRPQPALDCGEAQEKGDQGKQAAISGQICVRGARGHNNLWVTCYPNNIVIPLERTDNKASRCKRLE